MIARSDVKSLADTMRQFAGRAAIEPQEAAVAIAGMLADRAFDFNDEAAQAFFEACGFDADESRILALDIN